jgi:uncharacterized protein
MLKRLLGNTNLRVSILGLGSSQFRYGSSKDCARLIEQAYELGINYFDTAKSYTNGEESVSKLDSSVRDNLIITTKTGYRGGKNCLSDLQDSLKAMNRNWIDIWMTHMIETMEDYELCIELGGFCDIAYSAKKAGLIRGYGASFHAPVEVIERAIKDRSFEVIMIQFNLIGRETVFGSNISLHREVILPMAKENGIGVIGMKILAGGELNHGAPKLRNLPFINNGLDEIDASIRYAAMNPYLATCVIGVINTGQLAKNTLAVSGINDQQFDVHNLWNNHFNDFFKTTCTRCGDCIPACPESINIPKIIRLYDQNRLFGMTSITVNKYNGLEQNYLQCDKCLECNKVCREGINIPKILKLAHDLLHNAVMCKNSKY